MLKSTGSPYDFIIDRHTIDGTRFIYQNQEAATHIFSFIDNLWNLRLVSQACSQLANLVLIHRCSHYELSLPCKRIRTIALEANLIPHSLPSRPSRLPKKEEERIVLEFTRFLVSQALHRLKSQEKPCETKDRKLLIRDYQATNMYSLDPEIKLALIKKVAQKPSSNYFSQVLYEINDRSLFSFFMQNRPLVDETLHLVLGELCMFEANQGQLKLVLQILKFTEKKIPELANLVKREICKRFPSFCATIYVGHLREYKEQRAEILKTFTNISKSYLDSFSLFGFQVAYLLARQCEKHQIILDRSTLDHLKGTLTGSVKNLGTYCWVAPFLRMRIDNPIGEKIVIQMIIELAFELVSQKKEATLFVWTIAQVLMKGKPVNDFYKESMISLMEKLFKTNPCYSLKNPIIINLFNDLFSLKNVMGEIAYTNCLEMLSSITERLKGQDRYSHSLLLLRYNVPTAQGVDVNDINKQLVSSEKHIAKIFWFITQVNLEEERMKYSFLFLRHILETKPRYSKENPIIIHFFENLESLRKNSPSSYFYIVNFLYEYLQHLTRSTDIENLLELFRIYEVFLDDSNDSIEEEHLHDEVKGSFEADKLLQLLKTLLNSDKYVTEILWSVVHFAPNQQNEIASNHVVSFIEAILDTEPNYSLENPIIAHLFENIKRFREENENLYEYVTVILNDFLQKIRNNKNKRKLAKLLDTFNIPYQVSRLAVRKRNPHSKRTRVIPTSVTKIENVSTIASLTFIQQKQLEREIRQSMSEFIIVKAEDNDPYPDLDEDQQMQLAIALSLQSG